MGLFKLPFFKDNVQARMFERVETKDPQYDICDVGIQYDDGSIDSVVLGGSFASLKRWARQEQHVENARADEDASIREAEILVPVPDTEAA